jgi:hypothetical protein
LAVDALQRQSRLSLLQLAKSLAAMERDGLVKVSGPPGEEVVRLIEGD